MDHLFVHGGARNGWERHLAGHSFKQWYGAKPFEYALDHGIQLLRGYTFRDSLRNAVMGLPDDEARVAQLLNLAGGAKLNHYYYQPLLAHALLHSRVHVIRISDTVHDA